MHKSKSALGDASSGVFVAGVARRSPGDARTVLPRSNSGNIRSSKRRGRTSLPPSTARPSTPIGSGLEKQSAEQMRVNSSDHLLALLLATMPTSNSTHTSAAGSFAAALATRAAVAEDDVAAQSVLRAAADPTRLISTARGEGKDGNAERSEGKDGHVERNALSGAGDISEYVAKACAEQRFKKPLQERRWSAMPRVKFDATDLQRYGDQDNRLCLRPRLP